MSSGRGRASGSPGGPALPTIVRVALAVLLLAGCTFERRPDVENGDGTPDTAAVTRDEILRDSVEAIVDGFVGALRAGDVSRAVSMLDDRATLYDQETGRRWDPTAVDSLLPGPLERDGEALHWEPSDTWTEVYDQAALVVRRYRATISREAAPWTAMETYVLVRADGEWAIRHLHRSRGPGPGS